MVPDTVTHGFITTSRDGLHTWAIGLELQVPVAVGDVPGDCGKAL